MTNSNSSADPTDLAPPGTARSRSGRTRHKLIAAAEELIAEKGWGRVTTRAVAERAGLPHGTVSYHFRGKEELLTDAALAVIDDLFPMEAMESVDSLDALLRMMEVSLTGTRGSGSRSSQAAATFGVLVEVMREANRNRTLGERLSAVLQGYRRSIAKLARAEQKKGGSVRGFSPAGLATLVAAVGDGLTLHAFIDSGVAVADACRALRRLLIT